MLSIQTVMLLVCILVQIIISENLVKVIMNGCKERMYVKVSRWTAAICLRRNELVYIVLLMLTMTSNTNTVTTLSSY